MLVEHNLDFIREFADVTLAIHLGQALVQGETTMVTRDAGVRKAFGIGG